MGNFIHQLRPSSILIKIVALTLALLTFSSLAHSEEQSSNEPLVLLKEGIDLYEAKNFTGAAKVFEKGLQNHPENPTFLLNLGLTSLQLNQFGPAAAYLRKARELDPYSDDIRKALDELQKKYRIPDVPRQISTLDFFAEFIRNIPHLLFFFLSLVATVTFGAFLVRRAKLRKTSIEDTSLNLPVIIAAVFVLLSCGLYGFKLYDKSRVRGTIIPETVSVKSADDPGAPEITQYFAGMEVKVFERKGDWLKIQYPGSFLGWVPAESLMITSLTSPREAH